MSQDFKGWLEVAMHLSTLADDTALELNEGQRASLRAIAKRIPQNGVIIADEVGMGKTRIAVAVARSVVSAGGRVAILVPPGLGFQWGDELRAAGVDAPLILRSLDAYLNAWDMNAGQKAWGEHSVLLISHVFCNWSLKSTTKANWRWALLPETLAIMLAKIRTSGRVPRGYRNNSKLNDLRVTAAAKWIEKNGEKIFLKQIAENEQINQWGKNAPLFDPANYTKDTEFRKGLEKVVGVGLGSFDLIIIDEAHKSRGQESNLNRLLEHLILSDSSSRRLAMTATPVELDAEQWTQTLGRIKADAISASEVISAYAGAVRKVRQSPSDEKAREIYKKAAKRFKEALSPYLLRRDKREDPWVRRFEAHAGRSIHAYRNEKEILIETANLDSDWKQAVCAAESLSFVTRHSDDPVAKRLRLTLGNGHGVAALIDQQNQEDGASPLFGESSGDLNAAPDKRLHRAHWWKNVMIQPYEAGDAALFDHPAILAAAYEIEQVCQQGEKTLVFGRFTRPLRALVELLNAREMLRSLDKKQLWPQSKVHKNEWSAIMAAHRQLQRPGKLDRERLDKALAEQYKRIEQQRRNIRDNLIAYIEKGLSKEQTNNRVRVLFDIFKNEATKVSERDGDEEDSLAIVARAIQELIGPGITSPVPKDFATAFGELIDAASDRDEGDANGDGDMDEAEAAGLWFSLETRVRDEYNRQEGGFARLMYGETKPATRRLLQLAFNRTHGHPKVLVAQSVVGREGLNLHKACRTVVLLHPEWNPGVVEQQIGRVDRIGSLWEQKLREAFENKADADNLPRIEIRPVVFQGTYDEMNWQVLRDRWDDLRAQLHGIVISPKIADKYVGDESIVAEINAAAPNFSPSTAIGRQR